MEEKQYQCNWCHELFEKLERYVDDESGWCSEDCMQAHDDYGMDQWESQREDVTD